MQKKNPTKAEVLRDLETMLRDVLTASGAVRSYSRMARAHGYVDGFMRGLLDTGFASKAELLEIVGLADRSAHRPKELSGGEQQRVAIARALVNEPRVIYADEPTANLDSAAARTVMETLQRLNDAFHVTVLFVSHDPDDARYATRLIHLKDGRISEAPA